MTLLNIWFIYFYSDKKLNWEEAYMVERMYKKGLVIGIIMFFVCASVIPSISADIKNNDDSVFLLTNNEDDSDINNDEIHLNIHDDPPEEEWSKTFGGSYKTPTLE